MTRIVPFKTHYDIVKKINNISSFILWTSAILSLAILAIENFEELKFAKIASTTLNVTVTFASVLYFVLDLFQSFLFHDAEFNRKKDYVDNSFNTTLSNVNSQEYFTNDEVSPGVYKMGVNCFENSLFTMNVTKQMRWKAFGMSAVLIVLFIFLAFFSEQKIFASILQIALPFSILLQFIKLCVLHYQVKEVFETFKTIMPNKNLPVTSAQIIVNVLKYEKALSWAGITLDTKVFNALNPIISSDWIGIKQTYTRQ